MIRTACPIHRDASVEPKLAVHGAPLGGPQQMVMRDADRMQRRFDLAVPEVDEIEQCREVRRQTIVLPHEQLRSEEHTSELQSLMRISYDVLCLKKKKKLCKQRKKI